MYLLSWSTPPAGCTHIHPMTSVTVDVGTDPVARAAGVAPSLKADPYKTLFLFHAAEALLANTNAAGLIADIPSDDERSDYFYKFFFTLKSLNAIPKNVITDCEAWPGDWNWGTSAALTTKASINKIIALRRCLYWPLVMGFQSFNIHCANYGDVQVIQNTIYDLNEWPTPAGTQVSLMGDSALVMYNWQTGNMFNVINSFTHDIAWNFFCLNLNNIRCCGGKLMPWIAYPSYGGDNPFRLAVNALKWLWNETLRHLTAMGVEFCLYWNPTTADDLYAQECLGKLDGITVATGNLPAIALDVDSVATGSVVTNYNDYLAVLTSKDNLQPSPRS